MVSHINADEEKPAGEASVSRRSFMAALIAGVAAAALPLVEPTEAEAQERQFKSFRHEPRHSRPRSHTRGRRRHRRVARVHHRGPTRPLEPEAPAH